MKKSSGVALVSAVMLVVAMLGVSFATSLTLSSPTAPSFASDSRCSSSPASVSVTEGTAQVVVPEGCQSQDISLFLGASGAAYSVEVVSGQTISLPTEFSRPQAALVTVGTWPLPTSLDVGEPPVVDDSPFTCTVPAGECTVENLELSAWSSSNWPEINEYNASGSITTTSPTKQEWTLTINLSSPAFPFVADGVNDTQKGLVLLSDAGCVQVPRTITVKGTTTWGDYNYVRAGKPRNFQINGDLRVRSGKTYNLLSCP